MDEKFKVLVVVIPRYGHIYPLGSFVKELNRTKKVKVFFPGNDADRKIIESTGSEFIPMHIDINLHGVNMNEQRKNFPMDRMMHKWMDIGEDLMPRLADLVQREGIDLVIYDFVSLHGRWLKDYLKKLQAAGKFSGKLPGFVVFSPSLMSSKDIYPNKAEPPFYPPPKMSIMLFFKLILLIIRNYLFCWKFGINIKNQNNFLFYREEINLCCITPEFQPRSHLFEKSITFIGTCADEELRDNKEIKEPLKSFLKPFEPSNPVKLVNFKLDKGYLSDKKTRLIYASFGTVFNEDIKPFLDIIDAFNSIEQSESNRLRLLISTGEKTYAKFQEMIKKGQFKPQDDILLMNEVPQLEVLKRASVFINHSGQNSASEAIHFGVPMVCVPVYGDQPPVAYRCADELGLGVRIDYDEVNSCKIKDALLEVLGDKSYLERVSLFSQLSRKHDGPRIATDLVIQYLQKLKSN